MLRSRLARLGGGIGGFEVIKVTGIDRLFAKSLRQRLVSNGRLHHHRAALALQNILQQKLFDDNRDVSWHGYRWSALGHLKYIPQRGATKPIIVELRYGHFD